MNAYQPESRTNYKKLTMALCASVGLHLVLGWGLGRGCSHSSRGVPDEPISVTYLKLPKGFGKPKQSKSKRPQKPIKRVSKTNPVAHAQNRRNFAAPHSKPPQPQDTLLRREAADTPKIKDFQKPPLTPPPFIRERNADNTYVRYQDGSVTLRSQDSATKADRQGKLVAVQVTPDGRIADDCDAACMAKKASDMLPQGASGVDLDLAQLGFHAQRLSQPCAIYGKSSTHPDHVTILIDSSGSMDQNRYLSPAITCGYRLALSVLETSQTARVSVINFSSTNYVVSPTRDRRAIAKGLARSIGGDTFLPGHLVEETVPRKGKNDLVVISDGVIPNYQHALPVLKRMLERNQNNAGTLIVIGDKNFHNDSVVTKFIWAGFKVMFHKSFKRS